MKTIAVIAAMMLSACSADEPTPVAPPSFSRTAQLEAAALAAHSLGVNSLSEMQLLTTPAGREILARMVSCALPRGVSITAITHTGTPYSFSGRAGLAPGWAQRPANASERHLVNDCMLGRATVLAPVAPVAPAAAVTRV